MIKNTKITQLILGLLPIFSTTVWSTGVGYDANPTSITTSATAFSASTPTLLATANPSGGTLCSLSSSADGFKSASAKWRNPNVAGTFSSGGYTYQIQRTNISGIGVVARLGATFDSGASTNTAQTIGPEYKTIATTATGSSQVNFGDRYWGLVTIPGEKLVPGTYSLGEAETMVDVWCQASDASNDTHGGGYLTGKLLIDAPTCSFVSDVSSVMNVDLGKYLWVDVRNLSVGNNFGSATKPLSMECQAGTWPKLTITDKNNSSNSTSIISLTSPTASTTAKGIGVQIFINNQSTAQRLATQINLTPSTLASSQTIDLPIEFKYIKTSKTFSSGEANAIVDLTFTYD